MKKIKIIIERGEDLYAAYAENVEGATGAGETVAEARSSLLASIEILKEFGEHTPAILLGDYEFVYGLDIQSFLNYYKGIFTNSALERITGINQKQLQHYATGHRKPRIEQRKKIEQGLHRVAAELLAIEL